RSGRIWVAEFDGMVLYDHGKLTRFDRDHGHFTESPQGFFEDRDGSIWTFGYQGIWKYHDGGFHLLARRQAVPVRSVFGTAVDDSGAWWIVTRAGVIRLPPGEMQKAWADSAYQLQYRSFDQLDGLPGSIVQTMYGPLITRTLDNRIWVATDSGVASI